MIIDDVITMGATMIGAVSAVAKYFDVPVYGFVAVRTNSDDVGIVQIPDPVVCEVNRLPNGRTNRTP